MTQSVNPESPNEKPVPGGYLIAFEGIDGSGKTTAARNIAEKLREEGFNAHYLREPTDGPYGRRLREIMISPGKRDPQLEFELFLRDRRDDVEKNIRPILKAGGIVCIDRYYISSMAYQGALGLDMEKIRTENEQFAPIPNLILRFSVTIQAALERIHASRTEGANEFEKKEYLQLVNANFDRMNFPQMVDVPAEDEKEKVFGTAWNIVAQHLEVAAGRKLQIMRIQ